MDCETAPHTVYTWGLYQQNIALNQIISTGYVLCFSAKRYGDPEIIFDSGHKSGHKKMVQHAHRLLSDCDVVVHFNGKKFDMPVLNKEFLLAGLPPPPRYKQIDLYQVVRSTFRFASNKLDHVTKALGIGEKVRHEGQELWTNCMKGDPAAWERMEAYNKQDVALLEPLYERLRPWIRSHPNHGLYDEPGLPVCPTCGGGHLQRRGYARTLINKYARYQCLDCGSWTREAISEIPHEDRMVMMRPDLG